MLETQPPCDLLRRPLLDQQQSLHHFPQPRTLEHPTRLAAPSTTPGPIVCPIRPVRVPATIRDDLPPDRAAMPTEPQADLSIGLVACDPQQDLLAFLNGQRASTDSSFIRHPAM